MIPVYHAKCSDGHRISTYEAWYKKRLEEAVSVRMETLTATNVWPVDHCEKSRWFSRSIHGSYVIMVFTLGKNEKIARKKRVPLPT